jgi:hypothetical protein
MNYESPDNRYMKTALWKQAFPQVKDSSKSLQDILLSGEIPEQEYIQWATEAYKIPFLSDDFFQQTNNWKLIVENPNSAWNDYFFPIHEWQGMLYIGCLEPQKLEIDKKICMVLCSPRQLLNLWLKMERPVGADPASTSTVDVGSSIPEVHSQSPHASLLTPSPLDIGAMDFSGLQIDVPSASDPHSESTKNSTLHLEETKNPALEAPTLSPLQSDAATRSDIANTKSQAGIAMPPLFSTDTTEEKEPLVVANAPTHGQALIHDQIAKDAPAIQETIVVPTSKQQSHLSVNPNFTPSNFNIPEITNVVKANARKTSDTAFTSTKTIMPFPERSTQFTFIRTVYSEQVILEAKSKVQENTDPQEALMSAFRILKDYYKKLMWVVRDQKGQAFPIACNTEWEFSEEAWNLPMNFKTPNPFRIAKLTQKPFHGPVSPNPVSDMFFKQWCAGETPNVLSIVPVKLHGKVFGYFVGCEKGSHYHPEHSLELLESICSELIEVFVRIHKDLNKVA